MARYWVIAYEGLIKGLLSVEEENGKFKVFS